MLQIQVPLWCIVVLVALVVSCHADKEEKPSLQQDEVRTQPPVMNWKNPNTWLTASAHFIKSHLMGFNDFKRKFNKIYMTQTEETFRHALYTDRLMKAAISFTKYINKQLTSYKSVNSRSDMTKEEREQLLASRPLSVATEPVEEDDELVFVLQDSMSMAAATRAEAASYIGSWFAKRKPKVTQTYKTIDLRETNCFFPPGDQGTCSSCASFVAIAQLEFLRCRETGSLEKFSEQFTLDCGEPFGMMGCSGTDVHSLARFNGQVGLMLKETYGPYLGRKKRCPYYGRKRRSYRFESADTLKLKHEDIKGALLDQWSMFLSQKIPLHVGVTVNEEFEDYGGGVAGSCVGGKGAHGMLLVGEGRENGVDYWLLRNSYGTDWGMEGYYKMSKQAKGCFSDDGMGYYSVAFTRTHGQSFYKA